MIGSRGGIVFAVAVCSWVKCPQWEGRHSAGRNEVTRRSYPSDLVGKKKKKKWERGNKKRSSHQQMHLGGGRPDTSLPSSEAPSSSDDRLREPANGGPEGEVTVHDLLSRRMAALTD